MVTVAFATLVAGCSTAGGGGSTVASAPPSSPAFDYPETTLGPKRNGLNGWVLLGDEVSVRLPIDKSTGAFLRMTKEPDPRILEPTMRFFTPSGGPDVGHEVWRYRGIALGKTDVKLEYRQRAANGTSTLLDEYTVTIHVWEDDA